MSGHFGTRGPNQLRKPRRLQGTRERSGHISSSHDAIVGRVDLPDEAYARLLSLRTNLRRFERWSEQQARAAGLTPAQHQLLLAIRGHDDPRGPTIGEVADYLLLRHHSTVGLVDRADAAGLVTRTRSAEDHRVVRLHLSEDGATRLAALSAIHLEELERLAPNFPGAWNGLAPLEQTHGLTARP
jgi:DNA-binding MarR family transcriptional regulator